jgi:hypothetical protein
MLATIFGWLLRGILCVCVASLILLLCEMINQKDSIMCAYSGNAHPSRGIASFIYVGSTGCARIDVFSNDIDSLLLSLFVLIPIHVGPYVIGISID